MKRLLPLLIVAVCTLCAGASDRYATLATRAARSYGWGEWSSAAAMYELMLDMCPDSAAVYTRAIVASCLIPDTTASVDLLSRAMTHGQPLDSVLAGVRSECYALGDAPLYADYLHRLRRQMPWMRRALDHELLRYHDLRRDGPATVAYATVMLDGLPDSREFLAALARGHMYSGDLAAASGIWRRLLDLYPDDYDTLLLLGNYLAQHDPTAARPYLERAAAIRPAPALDALLGVRN